MPSKINKSKICCLFWAFVLLLIGAALIVVGVIVMKKILPDIVHDKVLEKKVVGKNSDNSDNTITRIWKNPEYKTFMQYWVYNYTNALEIQHRGAYPDMLEKGPYSYREILTNNVEDWSEDENEVLYRRKSVFRFDAETSCPTCKPDDVFVVPDIIFFKLMDTISDAEQVHDMLCDIPDFGSTICDSYSAEDINDILANFSDYLSIAMKARGAGPFISVKVSDLIFDGFDDPIITRVANFALDIVQEVAPLILKNASLLDILPVSLETPKANLNMNNDTTQVQYRMLTGMLDPYQAGRILSFYDGENGTNSEGNLLPESWWSNPDKKKCPPELEILARRINGTMGDFFKPFVEEDDKLYLYIPEICRSLYMVYRNRVNIKGIDGMHFIMPDDIFNYDLDYNCGFCHRLNADMLGKKKGDVCLPNGLLDISQCTTLNPPIAVSKPHFLGAAKEVLSLFPRIKPLEQRDEVSVDVEPNMGVVLKADKRLQINVLVSRYNNTKTYNILLPGAYPIVWLNESFVIDDGTVDMLNTELFGPQKLVKLICWIVGVGCGALLIVIAVVMVVCALCCCNKTAKNVVVKDSQKEAARDDKINNDTHHQTNYGIRRRVVEQKKPEQSNSEATSSTNNK